MATIGSLVIGLSLGTTGLAMGLNNVESQLKAFQNRVSGQTAITAQAAAQQQVALAQQQVVLAQEKLNVSTLRLNELQTQGAASASTLAAAQLTVRQSTDGLAAAQARVVTAQTSGAAAIQAAQDKLFLAQARLSISTLRLTELQAAQGASAATVAAAQLAVTRNTMAVSSAQAGVAAAQANAARSLALAQQGVVVAQERLNVSTLRLSELQARGGASASSLAAAQLTVTRNTHALTAAQTELAAAQNLAMNPAPANTWGGHFPYITAAATIAVYALAAFTAGTVRAASAFEYEMRLVQTQAAATREEVVELSDAILQLAPSLQTGPMELSKSMFRLKSVGLDNANALAAMEAAAKGARVGNASLDSVTTALIASMISGIDGIESWDQAMGLLNATVGVSNLRMEDLTNSLSSGILSTARQFGLEFLDVGAALGTMSNQAVPAEEGATRLRISIALLAAPTQIAARELAKIGLTERALADQMRGEGGLIGALTLLKTRMDAAGMDATEQSMLLKTAFGGSRSSAGILLLMNSLDELGRMYDAINAKAGDFAQDWAAESETASAKFATFSATMDVLSVRIGNGLLPVMTTLAMVLGFLADKTIIVVPLFYLIITAIGVALVKAVWGAIAGLVQLAATMALNVATAILLKTSFFNIGPIVVSSMAPAAGAMGAFNTQMAAANLQAAGFVPVMGSVGAAMSGTAASTGPVVAGFSGVNGAMAATAASTGPLITGVTSVGAAMAGTAVSTGPLVAGIAGASGAMAAGTASTGPLVAGLVGANGAMAATTASTGPLIAGVAGAGGAMAAATPAAGGLVLPLSAMGPAGVAAAGGVAAVGTASAAASPPVWSLAGAINAAIAPVWLVVAAIAAVIVAIALLVLNFDRVMQGLRGVSALFQIAKIAVLDFLSSIPFVGDAFKGAADQARAELAKLTEEVNKAEEEIRAKEGQGFDPLGDISGLVQAQIDAAKAEALSAFNDLNETLIQMYGTSMAGVQAAAKAAGAKDMLEYAKGIMEAQDAPKQAFIGLTEALANEMTPKAEAARLVGILQSEEYARGLASGDPKVVAYYEALKKTTEERLNEISDGGYAAAGKTWDEFYSGWYTAQLNANRLPTDIEIELRTGKMEDLKSEFAYLKKMWEGSLAPTPEEARAAMDAMRQEIDNGAVNVTEAAKAFVENFGYSLSALKEVGATAGADMMTAIADEIDAKSDAVMTSIAKLHDVIVNGLSTTAQEAFLLAALAGEDIANGLASSEPAVYARAVASRDLIIQQLDFLSNGSYSQGLKAFEQWSKGYYDAAGRWVPPQTGPAPNTSLGLTAEQLASGKSSYESYLNSLQSSNSSFISQYKSDMTSAFNEIKAKALEYFDAVHEKNLQAIRDAHDHRDALLEAKQALNQGPVDAAQRALDAQRKAIQEWRLREAVRTASSPEEYRDAVLALQDFLAQKKIDQMQAEADAANAVIDKRREANDKLESDRIKAENARYQKQKKDFERNLTALERYLKNHPEAWRRTQNEILALLNEYGVSYKNTGNLLGKDFAQGLKEQVKAAADAGTALANAAGTAIQNRANQIAAAAASAAAAAGNPFTGPYDYARPGTAPVPRAVGGPVFKGQPHWVGEAGKELFVPQANGYVLNHSDSMRAVAGLEPTRMEPTSPSPDLVRAIRDLAPAASPVSLDAIRRATERPEASPTRVRVDVAASRGSERALGGQTIIFQVGDTKLGELSDRALARQTSVYGGKVMVSNRSVR